MKKKKFLFSLLMAIVMMAMSPQKVWATANVTWSLGGAFDFEPAAGVWVGSSEGGGEQIMSGHLYLCFTPAGADSQLNNWITQLTSLSSNSGLDGACVDTMKEFLAANSQWNGYNANNPNFSANCYDQTDGAFGTSNDPDGRGPSVVTIDDIDASNMYDVVAIIFNTQEITADSKYVVIMGYGELEFYTKRELGLLEIGFASEWYDGDIDEGYAAPNNAVDGKWHDVGGHSLTAHPAAAATCTTAGYSSDCWSCSACGKYFSDAEGKNVIAASSVVIPAGHNFVNGACTKCGATQFTYKATSDLSSKFQSNFGSYGTVTCGTWTDAATPVTVTVSGNVTTIGDLAFNGWFGLTSITIPSTVTSIGMMAFNGCKYLTSVTIPDGVTTIAEMAFNGCEVLTSVTIPSTVTAIGKYAFNGCKCISSVTIPSGVTSIGYKAFALCRGLTSVAFHSIPQVGNDMFAECNNLTTKTLALSDGSYVYTGSETNYFPELSSYPTYTRSMTSQLETFVLPFAISVTGTENYKVYAATAVGACPEASLTGTIAAGTSVFIRMNDGVQLPYALTLTASSNAVSTALTPAATSVSGLNLTGSYAQTDLSSTAGYVLENGQFVKIANATTKAVSPFRAYVAGTGSADTYMVYTGHSFTSYTYNNDVTCTKNGTKTASCDNGCGTTDTKDDPEHLATGHSFTNYTDPHHTFCTACNHTFFRYTASERVTPKTISNLKNASGQGIYVDSQNTWDADTKEGVMEFNEPLAIIGDKAFEQCAFTGNLVIPSSVKSIGNNAFYKCGNLANVAFNSVPLVGSHVFDDCDEEIYYDLTLTDDSYVYTGNETNNFPAADIWAVYKRKNIKNKWGTLVVPFDVLADQEEYDLYSIISVDDDNLTLKRPEGTLAAGTPVLIRMSEAGKDAETGMYTLHLEAANTTLKTTITNPAAVDGYTLKGSYEVAEVGNNDYIISNNAFWKASGLKDNDNLWKDKDGNTMASDKRHVYCSPFRAYLASSTSNNAKMLSIGWNDDEDITAVETLDALTSDEAQYFDINGRKLNDLQQGINIVKRGNKTYKVLVK